MCNCIAEFDAKLKDHNGKIAQAILMRDDKLIARLLVQTEKLDAKKRKPVPAVVATFCPFCGERLADAA